MINGIIRQVISTVGRNLLPLTGCLKKISSYGQNQRFDIFRQPQKSAKAFCRCHRG